MQSERKKSEYLRTWLILSGFCAASLLVLILCFRASARLPDNVGRVLTGEEKEAAISRNSPLTEYVHLTPNASFPRNQKISKITIHHMADDLSLERLGEVFGNRDRKASSNYAIDRQGRVAMYVEESNRAWTSRSRENDNQAVTIEVANDEIGGDWHVSDVSYEKLIELCTDICRRNGIKELVWTGDADGTLTIHKMFYNNTECPGPYLESRMPDIASEVNERLGRIEE